MGLHDYVAQRWLKNSALQKLHPNQNQFTQYYLKQHGALDYLQAMTAQALDHAETLELALYLLQARHIASDVLPDTLSDIERTYQIQLNNELMHWPAESWRILQITLQDRAHRY